MKWNKAHIVSVAALALATQAWAQPANPLPDIQRGTIAVHLTPIVSGIGAPDYAISPPGDVNRLFVVEQKGLLLVIQNGALLPTPALDIQSRLIGSFNPANANDERGLLGLAFSPGFNTPGHVGFGTLYTFSTEPIPAGTSPTYPAPNGAPQGFKTVVNEWRMSTTDPNIVDSASRREIISFGKNANNHNGGTVAFGPDGYLYLAPGDGGNANDVGLSHIEPGGNAQNLSTPLGKFLRFDPVNPALTPGSSDPISPNGQYRIPVTNPFQGPGQVPEIYAYGLRNPYRYSFDRLTGDLIHADVGQNNIEEIDRIIRGGNYGWAIKEGDFLFHRADGTIGARSPGVPAGLIDPISGPLGTLEYDHTDGISITGGFVYRGSAIPELYGKYVFGDLALRNAPPRVDGRVFYADLETGEILEFVLPQFVNDKIPNGLTVHGFGQDANGELYALVTNTPANGTGGIVYRFDPVVPIGFDLKPETIKLNSPDVQRVHAFLEPPAPFTPEDIDVASIRLNNVVPVDLTAPVPVIVGDEDNDGIPDLKVYFSRSALQLILPVGDQVPVRVTGTLGGTQAFVGFDAVRVKGGHIQNPVANEVLAPGSIYPITYDVTSSSAQWAALMFSPDGGASWSTQMTQVPNTGTFDWPVPNQLTDNALVAVVEVEGGTVGAEEVQGILGVSDPFSIQGALAVPGGRATTRLLPPHPNPSMGRVSLGFSVARRGEVEMTVFDAQGRQVALPVRGIHEPGTHEVVWDGRRDNGSKAKAGLYFVRLRADDQEFRERLVIVE
jgi:glucose/arabinose dehydrogenase